MIRSLIILLLLGAVPNAMAAKKNESKSKPVVVKSKTTAKKETKKEKPAPKKAQDTDPVIGVKKFEFVGVKKTPPELLKNISSKYMQYSAFGDWTQDMIADIQKIPIVKEVHLIRDMTGNIRVQIQEKDTVAYLALDRYYWLDAEGQIIQEVPAVNLENRVFFSGPWKNAADFTKKNGSELLRNGLAFYSTLLSQGFVEKNISEIHFDAKLGWIMYRMGSRAPIIFGTQELPAKVERFLQVVPQLDPYEGLIVSMDADFHDRVVVKLKQEAL